jgi:hypothetical protein
MNHSKENILGNSKEERKLKTRVFNLVSYACYLSQVEPKKVEEAQKDDNWLETMYEELHQFTRNDVWMLVPRPSDHKVMQTKWIFKNKSNENGIVVRNKARSVAQGYTEMEGIDFDDSFARVA